MDAEGDILYQLMRVIEDRKRDLPPNSYTTGLFEGGIARIGEKIREEAGEVVAAAGEDPDSRHDHVVHEAADVLYHLWVLLAHCEVQLSEVEAELGRRFGVSGLDEKAARGKNEEPSE